MNKNCSQELETIFNNNINSYKNYSNQPTKKLEYFNKNFRTCWILGNIGANDGIKWLKLLIEQIILQYDYLTITDVLNWIAVKNSDLNKITSSRLKKLVGKIWIIKLQRSEKFSKPGKK